MKKILSLFLLAIVVLTYTPQSSNAEDTVVSPRVGCYKFTQNLRFGDGYFTEKQSNVLELQNTLRSAGYFNLTPTGYFGPMTYYAVRLYQKDQGMPSTGFVGPITREIIRSQFCTSVIPDPNTPPQSCQSWFDGCNSCGRSTPGGPMACTMMACIGTTNPPYCKAYFEGSLKACPTEKITDNMPIVCVTIPCNTVNKSYYIYENTRHEISEFDSTWVAQNCSVKETIVY